MEAQITSLVSVNSHGQHFNTMSKKKEPTVVLRQTSVNTFVSFFSTTYGAVCTIPSAQLWLCGMWTEWSYSFLGIMWSLGKQNRTYAGWCMKRGGWAQTAMGWSLLAVMSMFLEICTHNRFFGFCRVPAGNSVLFSCNLALLIRVSLSFLC